MRLRKITSKTKGIARRTVILVVVLTLAFIAPLQFSNKAYADKYDERIKALQQEINAFQAEADKLNSQAVTLQTALNQLANQKAAIQAQINLNQAKYDKLVAQIAETERQIKANKDALGETIADLYVDSNITSLEMLASSSNISDFLDKQEYRNSIRDELVGTISEIKDLKTKLETQKSDVKKVLAEKNRAKASLVAKENEQQRLLNQTKGQESNYQALIGDRRSEIDEARALQAILRARLNSNGGYTIIESGSLGAYPWNSSNCPMWGPLSTGGANGNGGDGYGYGCRQCASYVAWRIANETGVYYTNWGDGGQFVGSARGAGYNTGSTAKAGSIGVIWGNPGHVVWVETDPYTASNGSRMIIVSQYNYDYGQGYGMYSKMEMSANAFDEYAYIK